MADRSKSNITELPTTQTGRGEAFFVVGGPVQPRRPAYIERQADSELLQRLHAGEYCHVLAPRHSGKSSLVARTARALRREDYLTAVVDLSQTVGRDRSAEAGRWYYGIAYRIVRDLKLDVDLQDWWQEKKPLSALQRLNEFFRELVLGSTRSPIVIFLDEVESVEDLEHSADLFLSVRTCHAARATEPEFERLRFVMLGTALPSETQREDEPAYDLGRRIELDDLSFEQARPLCRELGLGPGDAERALYRIFYWTGGQPYLTQKICRAVARSPDPVDSDEVIDTLVRSRFLSGNAPQSETNLRATRQVLSRDGKLTQNALRIYRRVWRGRQIRFDRHSAAHDYLRTSGLVKLNADGRLAVRNRIYGQVFTPRWARQHLPIDWRTVITSVAAVVLLVTIPYWYVQMLPRPYEKTLRLAGVDYEDAVEAYNGLKRLPGFGGRADALFADVLERRSRQAATWDEALAADVELRGLRGYQEEADELLASFWERQAAAAESEELRDRSLIYRLRALERPTPLRLRRAAALLGQDYPMLRSAIRPGASIDALGIDPAGRTIVSLTTGNVVQTWDADTGLPTGTPGGFTTLAEEFVTVRRRISLETEGPVRSPNLVARIRHPQPTDLTLRLVAPSGRMATIPLRRQPGSEPDVYVFDSRSAPALATLRGEEARGTWSLEIEDRLTGTTGFLDGWEIVLSKKDGHSQTDYPGNPILIPDPRPTSQVTVVLSPDGRRAAAVSADEQTHGFLQIWDVAAGQVSARIPAAPGARLLEFDADGAFLVTRDTLGESRLNVWSTASGQQVLTLESGRGFASGPAMSVVGSILAIAEQRADADVRIRLLDLSQGIELRPLVITGGLDGLALGPDGLLLATLDREHVVRVWDTRGGSLIAEFAHDRPVDRLVFDRTGRWLATVDRELWARVWSLDPAAAGPRPLLARESWDPASVAFSPDGNMLLLHSRARTFELLALPSGIPLIAPLRHSGDRSPAGGTRPEGQPTSVAFSADGRRIVTGRGGPAARVWAIDAAYSGPVTDEPTVNAGSVAVAVNPVSYQIVRGDFDGGVRFRDRGLPWSPTPAAELTAGHAGAITALAFSTDGSRLVSVGADGSVLLWDAAARVLAGQRFHHGSGRVTTVGVAPDDRRIVTGGELGARLWDAETGQAGPVLGTGGNVVAVSFTANGGQVVTLASDAVQIWSADDGVLLWSASLPGVGRRLAVRRDGGQIAVALDDGRILFYTPGSALPDPAELFVNGQALALKYNDSGDRLVLQTGEWMHMLDPGEIPTVLVSRLLPGIVPAAAWRIESADADQVLVLVRQGADGMAVRPLHLSDPKVPPGRVSASGGERLWLDRLKLRFDASGPGAPHPPGAEPRRGPAPEPAPAPSPGVRPAAGDQA